MGAKRSVLAALAAAAVLVAACSSDDDQAAGAGDAAPAAADATTTTTTAPDGDGGFERFTGTVDDFYRVPDDLEPGRPGQVIRTMPVDDAPAGEAGLRIMYHSTDAEGDDRAVTGVVYWPDEEAPDGGWPVLAWAHGTTGLAPQCAPSRGPSVPPSFGVHGVRVATDYIGLGPVGELHPYLSAAAEGNAVVDGVAAVRSLPEVGAGDRWVVAGVSQGGHAALVSAERAAERLPDAELLGTVSIAPGAQLGESYGDEVQLRIITTMVLVGAAAEDPTVDVGDYLGPDGVAATEVIRDGCMDEILATVVGPASAPDYFETDPRTAVLGQEWVAENDPGQVAVEAPLLLVQGGRDGIVVPARTAALLERLCGLGQVVEFVDLPTADHDTVTGEAADRITAWIADRFAGDAPVDAC